MTREQEIRQQANDYTLTIFGELDDFQDVTDAYIDGAKWADKSMIEKACTWIQQVLHIEEDVEWFDDGQRRVFTTIKTSYDNNHELIDAFKRAMEE